MTLQMPQLSEGELRLFQKLIYDIAGVSMSDQKRALIAGRLGRRLRTLGLTSYRDYYKLITSPSGEEERQMMVDLLTTHETYFFREPKHFHYLGQNIIPTIDKKRLYRVWSAAASTGEEVWSLAMIFADRLGQGSWQIHGSDISRSSIEMASRAIYPLADMRGLTDYYKKKYCLKGVGQSEGLFRVDPTLKKSTSFSLINLKEKVPSFGHHFDLIVLRNILIYFDRETKAQVVQNVVEHLKIGGFLFLGHAESLHGIYTNKMEQIQTAIYRKVE